MISCIYEKKGFRISYVYMRRKVPGYPVCMRRKVP